MEKGLRLRAGNDASSRLPTLTFEVCKVEMTRPRVKSWICAFRIAGHCLPLSHSYLSLYTAPVSIRICKTRMSGVTHCLPCVKPIAIVLAQPPLLCLSLADVETVFDRFARAT